MFGQGCDIGARGVAFVEQRAARRAPLAARHLVHQRAGQVWSSRRSVARTATISPGSRTAAVCRLSPARTAPSAQRIRRASGSVRDTAGRPCAVPPGDGSSRAPLSPDAAGRAPRAPWHFRLGLPRRALLRRLPGPRRRRRIGPHLPLQPLDRRLPLASPGAAEVMGGAGRVRHPIGNWVAMMQFSRMPRPRSGGLRSRTKRACTSVIASASMPGSVGTYCTRLSRNPRRVT